MEDMNSQLKLNTWTDVSLLEEKRKFF